MGTLRVMLALFVVAAHIQMPSFLKIMGGGEAVQCFYMVSGFYMALVLTRKYTGPGSTVRFWGSRFFRLWPAYFLVVALTVAIALVMPFAGVHSGMTAGWEEHRDDIGWGWQALFGWLDVTLLFQDTAHFFAVSPVDHLPHWINLAPPEAIEGHIFFVVPQAWTIGLELWFYLLAPFIVRRSLPQLALLAVAGVGIRLWGFEHGLNRPPWDYRFFPFEFSLFILGVIAYRIYERYEGLFAKNAGVVWKAGMMLPVLTMGFRLIPWPSWIGLSAFYLAFAALIPPLFHFTKRNKFDRWFGEFSYLIYIVHLVLINSVALLVSNALLRIVIFGGSLVVVCWILRRYVEDPVTRWRMRKFEA